MILNIICICFFLIYLSYSWRIDIDFNFVNVSTRTGREENPYLVTKPVKHSKCSYPFDKFLSNFDRDMYRECLRRTALSEEQDANNLEEAQTFYAQNYGSSIPRHFKKWFEHAKENKCRINRYDQLHSQLSHFKNKSVNFDQALKDLVLLFNNTQLTQVFFKDGKLDIKVNSERASAYIPILSKIEKLIPDMDFLINTHAQPIVLHNEHMNDYQTKFNQFKKGLGHVELSLINKYKKEKKSIVRLDKILDKSCTSDLYRTSLQQGYGLFINAPDEFQTFTLAPILSWGGYPGCTKDILIPSVYHYEYKKITEMKYDYPRWDFKQINLVWKGTTSGSPFYYPENHKYAPDHICVAKQCELNQFKITTPKEYQNRVWFYSHRQRLVTVANLYPSIMDVDFVDGVEVAEEFTRESFKFYKKGLRTHFSRFFYSKFILDIDGNGYSGRFLKLLRGNSLIFAAHYASDWFSDITIPFYHYIPVNMAFDEISYNVIPFKMRETLRSLKAEKPKFDFVKKDEDDDFNSPLGFNDLAPKTLYYLENLEVSEAIALQGQAFANTYLREEDMDCFLFRTLIELYEILTPSNSHV